MTIDLWIAFFALAAPFAFSPGPAIVMAVSNAVDGGARATFWASLGNAAGLVILGMLATFGLNALLLASATAFAAAKILGALYLVWLGVKMWRDQRGLEGRVTGAVRRRALLARGLALSLTNPKGMLTLAALLPPFLPDQPEALLATGAKLSIAFALLCLLVHHLDGVVASRARRLFADAARLRFLRRIFGATMVGLGVNLALEARR